MVLAACPVSLATVIVASAFNTPSGCPTPVCEERLVHQKADRFRDSSLELLLEGQPIGGELVGGATQDGEL